MSLFARALHLLGLTLAPTLLSPEPLASSSDTLKAIAALVLFAAVLGGTAFMARNLEGKLPKIAAVWSFIAVVSLLGAAAYHQGNDAPLARAVGMVALPVWGALATSLAALAVRFLGDQWSNKALVAVLAVSAAGAGQLSRSASFLADPEQMWWAAIKMDGAHRQAVRAVSAPLLRARKWADANKVAEKCLKIQPEGCACLELRAETAIKLHDVDVASGVAKRAIERCSDPSLAHALSAEASTMQGKPSDAETEARAALASARDANDKARLKLVLASALAQQG
ncbi:MAG: hypothetical protein U0165_06140 [Polyangiaceae bacterium]